MCYTFHDFMKNTYLTYLVIGGLAFAIPALAAPAFVGPSTSPPAGNVEGVIWNLPPGSAPQTANINISGDVKTNNVNLGADLVVSDSKSLQVAPATPGSPPDYHIRAKDSVGSISGLKLDVEGSVIVTTPTGFAGPFTIGKDGRVQGDKFCFNPGNPADCITSWAGAGGGGVVAGPGITVSGSPSTVSLDTTYTDGKYVLKAGDTMTGGLTVNFGGAYGVDAKGVTAGAIFRNTTNANNAILGGPNVTLNVSGGSAGNPAAKIGTGNLNSNGLEISLPSGSTADGLVIGTITGFESRRGVTAYADLVGGHFEGANYGVEARARSSGSGSAVRGFNGNIGGDFAGSSFGVSANGGSGGSYFTNGSGQYSYIAYPGFGIYSDVGGAGNYALYSNGSIYTSGNSTVVNSTVNGQMTVNGDMDVAGNQWGAGSSPTFDGRFGGSWPNLGGTVGGHGNKCGSWISTGDTLGASGWVYCPDGTYLAGMKKSSEKITNLICCEL